ncbi:MAG: PilN domain-containing protein [Gemmatimonadota bacterium]
MLIEINLAPGASSAKLGSRRMPSFGLPSMPAIGGDAKTYAAIAAGVLLLALVLFGYLRMGTTRGTLEAQIQQEVADSMTYATTIALVRSLQARQDTVEQKIDVIRSVDTRRYVWPHLLDEISLAVPAYTWLTDITSTEPADTLSTGPVFTIQGNAGSTAALTRFMKNLEASPFIGAVTLITSEQEVVEGRRIQRFSLEASYRRPDPSVIQTVPIVVLEE